MTRIIDITGCKYGRLTVLQFAGLSNHHESLWECKCDCGSEIKVKRSSLVKNKYPSCGCAFREVTSQTSAIHGLYRDRIYNTYNAMKQRCLNPNNPRYDDYGGRGITICEEWLSNFMNFYNWAMENGYRDDLTIERDDVNGNYEPGNCSWKTRLHQVRNQRRTKITIDDARSIRGDPRPYKLIAEEYGITPMVVIQIKNNYTWKE